MSIQTSQAVGWIKGLRFNIQNSPITLPFLSEQYFLLDLMVQAINGDVVFVGAPDPESLSHPASP